MLEVDKNVLTPQSSLEFAPCDQFPRPLEQGDQQMPRLGFESDTQSELAQLVSAEVGLVGTEPIEQDRRTLMTWCRSPGAKHTSDLH